MGGKGIVWGGGILLSIYFLVFFFYSQYQDLEYKWLVNECGYRVWRKDFFSMLLGSMKVRMFVISNCQVNENREMDFKIGFGIGRENIEKSRDGEIVWRKFKLVEQMEKEGFMV